ncbi:MAG: hypothetical protein JJ958_07530 [Balneola sp.]|nr:hypothetical protein [Balneola sp.]
MLMIPACSDAPTKIERDNPDDPEVIGFALNPVQDISTNILEDKVIEVVWTDSSKVPTNYILKKRIRASDNYIALDTLDKDTRKFIDESGEFTKDTKYEIISLRKQESGEEVFSSGINSEIDFGNLVSPTYTYNADTTAIIFTWEFDTDWPFSFIVTTYDNDLERDVVLDTLSNTNTYTTPTFEKDFQDKFFDLKFFVSDINIDLENPYERYSGLYHILDFIPEISNIKVINEGNVVINWEDNSGFEDGFQILRSQGLNRNHAGEPEVIATVPSNTTSFTDTLNPIKGYVEDENGGEYLYKTYYGILAYKNETKTGSFGTEAKFTPPEVSMNLGNTNSTSFLVDWFTSDRDKIDSFILQKSYDGINFNDYKIFDKLSTSSWEQNLNKDGIHYYRIKTKTSKVSNVIAAKHSISLEEIEYISYPGIQSFRLSDSGDFIVATKGSRVRRSDDKKILVLDTNNFGVVYEGEPTSYSYTGVDIDENNTLLALASSHSNNLTLFNYNSKSEIFRINDVQIFDIELDPTNKFAYSNSLYAKVNKFSLSSQQILLQQEESNYYGDPKNISVSPTGDTVAINFLNKFKFYNDSLATIPYPFVDQPYNSSNGVKFTYSGKLIHSIYQYNFGVILNLATNEYLRLQSSDISINYDDTFLVTKNSGTNRNRILSLVNLAQKELIHTQLVDSEIIQIEFLPAKNQLIIVTSRGIYKFLVQTIEQWHEFHGDFLRINELN